LLSIQLKTFLTREKNERIVDQGEVGGSFVVCQANLIIGDTRLPDELELKELDQ
jgi:hypothetical protein